MCANLVNILKCRCRGKFNAYCSWNPEIIFALFDLLGFRFTPRLRDLGDRRLFTSGAIDMQRYPRLQPHIPGRINRPRILNWWDEQEYGRLACTLHILRWYAYPEERRRMLRQLNKGEALHDLRAALMIANKGTLRHRRGEVLAHQASCLDLVTKAVIVWNTVYMAAVVEHLTQAGIPCRRVI